MVLIATKEVHSSKSQSCYSYFCSYAQGFVYIPVYHDAPRIPFSDIFILKDLHHFIVSQAWMGIHLKSLNTTF